VLRERARETLANAGLRGRPADSDLFIEQKRDGLIAVYRQSKSAMRVRYADGVLKSDDPPLREGMANVRLDASGALLAFTIVPSEADDGAIVEPKWDPFLNAAGFDASALHATAPRQMAPVDTDHKFAWLAKDGRRIEAASFHNRPVWFSSEALTKHALARRRTVADQLAWAMFVAFMIAIPMFGLALARANLRRKQIDRAGALRAALVFGVAMLIALVFDAHHPMTFVDEWIIGSWHIAQATFWALITAIVYVALEPVVRRRWPQILIS